MPSQCMYSSKALQVDLCPCPCIRYGSGSFSQTGIVLSCLIGSTMCADRRRFHVRLHMVHCGQRHVPATHIMNMNHDHSDSALPCRAVGRRPMISCSRTMFMGRVPPFVTRASHRGLDGIGSMTSSTIAPQLDMFSGCGQSPPTLLAMHSLTNRLAKHVREL